MTRHPIRQLTLALLLGPVATGLALAQDCNGTISADEAVKAENARYAAQTSNDFAAMDRLFGDDLVYNHSSAATDSKASYIESMRSGRTQYVRMVPNNDVKVRTFGCVAIISGTASYDVKTGGQDRVVLLRYSTIWAKRAAGPQFVSWQSTGLPAKP